MFRLAGDNETFGRYVMETAMGRIRFASAAFRFEGDVNGLVRAGVALMNGPSGGTGQNRILELGMDDMSVERFEIYKKIDTKGRICEIFDFLHGVASLAQSENTQRRNSLGIYRIDDNTMALLAVCGTDAYGVVMTGIDEIGEDEVVSDWLNGTDVLTPELLADFERTFGCREKGLPLLNARHIDMMSNEEYTAATVEYQYLSDELKETFLRNRAPEEPETLHIEI